MPESHAGTIAADSDTALLQVRKLGVTFGSQGTATHAVKGVSFDLRKGETVALVGESGSGKSVTALSILQLLPYPVARHTAGSSILFRGAEMIGAPAQRLREVRGNEVSMIFQEPMTSLNPLHTVEKQVNETLILHKGMNAEAARRRTLELLDLVGIKEPAKRLSAFPHELSGGQRQRVMIAMALANEPELLIADEPTTALDVTIQAQILDLLLHLQRDRGMALVLITHDMGVVAETAQRVNVMYAGQQVELRNVDRLFESPRHSYTAALLDALPERSLGGRRLPTIPGVVPGAGDRPEGCLFNPRCRFVQERCRRERPRLEPDGHGEVRCFYPLDGGSPQRSPRQQGPGGEGRAA